MLLLKDGVLLKGTKYINAILTAVQKVYEKRGVNTIITAGRDGHAGIVSYHNDDKALDVRFWLFTIPQRELVATEIRAQLPHYYDVVVEGDHFHIECDTKRELAWLATQPKGTVS